MQSRRDKSPKCLQLVELLDAITGHQPVIFDIFKLTPLLNMTFPGPFMSEANFSQDSTRRWISNQMPCVQPDQTQFGKRISCDKLVKCSRKPLHVGSIGSPESSQNKSIGFESGDVHSCWRPD